MPLVHNVPVVVKRSGFGYEETVSRVVEAVERRGLTLFARIDHAAGAREVGLELADEQVLVFGSAQAGTPLMQSDPRIGIELPLRMLAFADADCTLLGYNDPRDFAGTFNVAEHTATLERMAALLGEIAREAAG
jgi:uncharacterized protein (DUF302 family)